MRSDPTHRAAGKRARRFCAATSFPVIRVRLTRTGASVRLASVAQALRSRRAGEQEAKGCEGARSERFPGSRSGRRCAAAPLRAAPPRVGGGPSRAADNACAGPHPQVAQLPARPAPDRGDRRRGRSTHFLGVGPPRPLESGEEFLACETRSSAGPPRLPFSSARSRLGWPCTADRARRRRRRRRQSALLSPVVSPDRLRRLPGNATRARTGPPIGQGDN